MPKRMLGLKSGLKRLSFGVIYEIEAAISSKTIPYKTNNVNILSDLVSF